jgi:hypothetical protein
MLTEKILLSQVGAVPFFTTEEVTQQSAQCKAEQPARKAIYSIDFI